MSDDEIVGHELENCQRLALWASADLAEEQGDEETSKGLRWMATNNKWPSNDGKPDKPWTWYRLGAYQSAGVGCEETWNTLANSLECLVHFNSKKDAIYALARAAGKSITKGLLSPLPRCPECLGSGGKDRKEGRTVEELCSYCNGSGEDEPITYYKQDEEDL